MAVASVLGREPEKELLFALTPQFARSAVQHALAQALDAEILVRSSAGTLRFSHILLRDVIYTGIAEADRAALHAACADAIFARHSKLKSPRSKLAHHLARAGAANTKRAIEAACQAAEEAAERFAFEEDASWLERALALQERLEPAEPESIAELSLRLARARSAGSDAASARALCLRAAELAKRQAAPELFARAEAAGFGGTRVQGGLTSRARARERAAPAQRRSQTHRAAERHAGARAYACDPHRYRLFLRSVVLDES